jgi:hypothetical protein
MKPDMQKFIFATFMFAGGLTLCIVTTEYGDQGPWLISFAVGTVFGIAKKPVAAAKLLLLSVILCAGCVGPQLDTDFIILTKKVFDRHDTYLAEDATLISLEREAYLEESAACREYLNAVQIKECVNYP